jgi:hypothetical protein
MDIYANILLVPAGLAAAVMILQEGSNMEYVIVNLIVPTAKSHKSEGHRAISLSHSFQMKMTSTIHYDICTCRTF